MTSSGTPRPATVSVPTRRGNVLLWWSLLGLLTQAVGYAVADRMQDAGWVTPLFPSTVLWCTVPYLLAARWLYQGSYLPPLEQGGFLLVVTTVAFLLAPLGFALLQEPYSRGAVLLAYVLALAWLLCGHGLWGRRRTMHLAYLDAGTPLALRQMLRPQEQRDGQLDLVCWTDGLPPPAQRMAVDGVVIDRLADEDLQRLQWISELKLQRVPLYSTEAAAEMLSGRKITGSLGEQNLWQLASHPAYDIAKRMLDVGLTLATLPLWVPLCLGTGLAVKLDSPGPMLYSQARMGRHGRTFRIWKLRSMRHQPADRAAQFARQQDDRVTRVGRFIRRTRLDELPQLWNVLLGDMSLIGPRPEQVQFAQDFAAAMPAYPYRHLVRPGLTGWAQVQQGYADSAEQTAIKLSYDLYYVAHYSMALDLLIGYKTVRTVLTGFGAR
ncbi:exopolysaccharide biosynthesis polyprenyl glycosylphosphotransferase [Acidovorax sp. NCPPB 4044]|uniref:exopolysaccharide biosynthesis polyprenyl glycosylphosphotransferase n=1 Tax=Acidovorax sp. NCPPB 4044 TaxID=2940490 RepID=UPI0023044049|nr:exopolysaccharide biosynthesis polyprenyl glycosylphosphotransferase [Acidovorax sp. NCPPB 4044]MDA8519716.1 exopolysaccharide biosynthesis polyprenyl glycosylphosphotransferase [Acidovorax sp. NCPPB 4044]